MDSSFLLALVGLAIGYMIGSSNTRNLVKANLITLSGMKESLDTLEKGVADIDQKLVDLRMDLK